MLQAQFDEDVTRTEMRARFWGRALAKTCVRAASNASASSASNVISTRPPPPPELVLAAVPVEGGVTGGVEGLVAVIVSVPVSLLAFMSFEEFSVRFNASEPAPVGVTFKSICRWSPAARLPIAQVAVPAPLVHVPPFAVTDCSVRLVGKAAVTDTSVEASSPLVRGNQCRHRVPAHALATGSRRNAARRPTSSVTDNP